MKKIDEYSTIEEMTEDFDNWFGYWLTGWSNEKECFDVSCRDINAFTDEIVEIMIKVTDWQFDAEELKTMNRWNLVYWYCVRLLYLRGSDKDDYLYYDDVYEFLDNMRFWK